MKNIKGLEEAKILLKKYFGYDSFRKGQEELIQNILNNKDVLGIMPTGAGKSICYQIPALLFDGVTIVISPLISLMKDQVDNLNSIGISATYINSSLSTTDYFQTMQNAVLGMYKIIYVAPERLDADSFVNLLNRMKVSQIAVDEAHCVSRWGHDFRPSYREIANVILNLKQRPIITAFTATATQVVKEDIIQLLKLNNPFTITTGFDRKNLYFSVESPENRNDYIRKFIGEHKEESTIIYCATRKNVDAVYEMIEKESKKYEKEKKIETLEDVAKVNKFVSRYHAGLTEKQRTTQQEDFLYDRTMVMVATNAFGMGIDKSNIRNVIHYNMPKDIESYYQEAGRAGRDGEKSNCILLFSRSDIITNKFLIEQNPANHSQEIQKLNDIVDYCNTDKCLRKYILEYFGEIPLYDKCENCSNCNSEIELTNMTLEAKMILSCIQRMRQKFGLNLVTEVLKGAKTAKIRQFKFDELTTYGIMNNYSRETIKSMILFLISEGYIEQAGDEYPILVLSQNAGKVLFEGEEVYIKRKIEKELTKEEKAKLRAKQMLEDEEQNNIPIDQELFEKLRNWRMETARKENVPPFIITSDATLNDISARYPQQPEQMLQITGIGELKFSKYGQKLIEIVKEYLQTNNLEKEFIEKPKNKLKNKNIDVEELIKQSKESELKQRKDTNLLSYELYKQGKSIKEIATIRNLSETTIETHLLNCYQRNLPIDLTPYVQIQYKEQIIKAIEKCGAEKLRPIKDELPAEVTYFDIKYYLIG